MSGSKRSGGFGLRSPRLLNNTPIEKMLESLLESFRFELREGEIITIKKRKFCWIGLNKDRFVNIPRSTLKEFDVLKNKKLLIGRGSGIALGFIAKGPIYDEAKNHNQIPIY